MRVAITGSTGLIGSALVQALRWGGDEVVRLVRHEPRSSDERQIFPDERRIADPGLSDVDAVVNLAGSSIAGGRWTQQYKRDMLASRISMTETVVAALAEDGRCQRFVSGSAIGYYGPTGDHAVDEAGVDLIAKDGKVVGVECIRMELGEPDASGRRRPVRQNAGGQDTGEHIGEHAARGDHKTERDDLRRRAAGRQVGGVEVDGRPADKRDVRGAGRAFLRRRHRLSARRLLARRRHGLTARLLVPYLLGVVGSPLGHRLLEPLFCAPPGGSPTYGL